MDADWASSKGPTADANVLTGMDLNLGVSEADIEQAEIPNSIALKMEADEAEALMKLRQDLVTNQAGCRAAVRDELQAKEADAQRASLRRHDYRPFLTEWLKALKEQDSLDTLRAKV